MPIPLFQLPQVVVLQVVRHMPMAILFIFSYCSPRTKSLVKDLKLRSKKLTMRIGLSPTISVETERDMLFKINFTDATGGNFKIIRDGGVVTQRPRFAPPMTLMMSGKGSSYVKSIENQRLPGYYITHLIDILNHREGVYIIDASDVFEPASIVEALQGVHIDRARIHKNMDAQSRDAPVAPALSLADHLGVHCDTFYPETYRSRPKRYKFTNPEVEMNIAKLITQNFKTLVLDTCLTVDQLTSLHAEYFICNSSAFSKRELQTFVSLWMRGCAAHRMKQISLSLTKEGFSMNGIKFTKRDDTVIRNFLEIKHDGSLQDTPISGGYDIERVDKTKATVKWSMSQFIMIVWDEV